MKTPRLFTPLATMHRLSSLVGAALLATSLGAMADTQVNVWHTLDDQNAQALQKLAKQFSKRTPDVRVTLKQFTDPEALDTQLNDVSDDKDRPHLVQLEEAYVPDAVEGRSYLMPLHVLMAQQGIQDIDWFLPASNTAARDNQGRLQAFPFMLEIPVMFYNTQRFRKAEIQPAKPSRDWAKLQSQMAQVANNGTRHCPITSDLPVSINLENLAAVNKQPFVSQGQGAPLFKFDSLYIRHLSLMISWVRTELMVRPDFDDAAAQRFADGECAALLSGSSRLGRFDANRALRFGISGIPYYPEVTQEPGLPFVAGSSLWATKGHAGEDDAATAAFLSWLAESPQALDWYETTGFLPLTKQAFAEAQEREKVASQWLELVAPYADEPVATARGFQIRNYPRIRALFKQTLGRALSGDQPAVPALKQASEEAGRLEAGQ